MTQYIGLIGYPLKHSLSPLFQQAALDYYHLDMHYQVWEVERVEGAMACLNLPHTLGANVTVPHKEAIITFLDSLEAEARQIGAVNTVLKQDGRLTGHNTDAAGFLRALKAEGGLDPQGKSVVIFGAGGVARAVLFALLQAGAASLAVFNRTPERARSLVDSLCPLAHPGQRLEALPWRQDIVARVLPQADLVVNCTTLGLKHSPGERESPVKANLIPPGCLVYDLVYNPWDTPLLQEARKAGAHTLGGLAMLVYQGAASFELWTGKAAPLDIMFQAARRAAV